LTTTFAKESAKLSATNASPRKEKVNYSLLDMSRH
jgi:hypothetical protein